MSVVSVSLLHDSDSNAMASIAKIVVILFVTNIYIYISHKDSNYFAMRHFLLKKKADSNTCVLIRLICNDFVNLDVVSIAG